MVVDVHLMRGLTFFPQLSRIIFQ